ncbi:MAG: DUF4954 family protein [Pseudoflavonifractor sp.]|nr:DUF4954 family protein [Pseudoflavonifractor sp.]
MPLRRLTVEEIGALTDRGCTATDWNDVTVTEPFDATRYRDVAFMGRVSLGRAADTAGIHGCPKIPCGIYNATLHDVTIGDNVLIKNISGIITGYDIADNATIEDCGYLISTGESAFGLGEQVAVMVETGGREIPLNERLSAPLAWLVAMRRDDRQLTEALTRIIADDNSRQATIRARIGAGAKITGVRRMTDVMVGDNAMLQDCSLLANGTISGSDEQPAEIGADVIARDFVAAAGCCVIDGVTLERVFVGQGVHLGNRFTAHDSLFFANCTCENGEACAVFAGPYTVTMHRSTLLIGGMFSFYNAGSGTNQSNHMYKLGPSHQGVLARGSKTASDSYILWPASIGTFSMVMGHVTSRPDTTGLPFSYIIDDGHGTFIAPGVALCSAGTARDTDKWPGRDRRHMATPLDPVSFGMLTPYTVGAVMEGIDILTGLQESNPDDDGNYTYGRCLIRVSALRRGLELYRLALDLYMTSSLLHRLMHDGMGILTEEANPSPSDGSGRWLDLGGLIAPAASVTALEEDIINSRVTSVDEINDRFNKMHADFDAMEWQWTLAHFGRWWGAPFSSLTASDILAIADRHVEAVTRHVDMLRRDAAKEFFDSAMIGYGITGEGRRQADFDNVRGTLGQSPFSAMLDRRIASAIELRDYVRQQLGDTSGDMTR